MFVRRLLDRFFDVLLSVYLYNEQRGFRYLEELALAFERKFPEEKRIIAAVRKHAGDERKHYGLFCRYFENRRRMPFLIGESCGYCDRIVSFIFGRTIAQLDPERLILDDEAFFRLCRLIMVTEMRGMRQVDMILKNFFIRKEPELVSIFEVVKRDEPSHCYPYQSWLRKHGEHEPSFHEKLADAWVHYTLLGFKLPLLFFNPWLPRREGFPVPVEPSLSVAEKIT